MSILKQTDFTNLGAKKIGKVRDVYVQSDKIILITTDRLTGFDRILAHIPHKGAVLNLVSAFWFEQTKDIIPNHVIDVPDPNVTVCMKCDPLRIEGVVRGYLTGITDTAIWTRYQKGERNFGGVKLPDGMEKNQKLSRPIFDPTTKEDVHDRTLSKKQMIAEGFISEELFAKVEKAALALFKRGQEIATKRGLILVDTKYEFGLDNDGTLTLIDEIHTPDSSRWWKEGSQDFMDKEFLRLWFKDHCDPYKDKVMPEAPPEMIAELSRRYIAIYELLTGKKFEIDATIPIEERIEKNLKKYEI